MGCYCYENTNLLLLWDIISSNFVAYSYLNNKLNPVNGTETLNANSPTIV
jgi:hypothetical protein